MKPLILIVCVSFSMLSLKAQRISLKGFWQADDGTNYYINHDGLTNVWWYSESDTTQQKAISVAYGYIRNDTLYMKWSFIPTLYNDKTQHGELVIYIFNSSKFQLVAQSGGFPSSVWTRRKINK